MIKNRVFMMGLGIGLVLGAVLLQLSIMGERSMSSTELQEKQWTKEEIEQGAKSLNLTIVDEADPLMTEEQWKEKMKQDSGKLNGTSVVPPSKVTDAQNPDSPKTPEKPDHNKKNTNTPTVKEPSSPKEATIRYVITKGSNLSHVAEGLKRAGVITDKVSFIKAASAKKINSQIQTGTYTFTAGESFQSIIKKISEKPSGDR
ncbi:hypothetical protein ACK8P5_16060 [Paenibacillus sp. EC2-1]|uniref:hypothetical protein n=1 Tax=Paenibacillus sp. EC2-1 TaxID=3388665 RepID=UPI003BEEB81E